MLYVCFQGNPPLDLPTCKSREDGWSKKKPLEFYLSADNVDDRKRSDAAIYFVGATCASCHVRYHNVSPITSQDDDGVLCYRPAPNGDSGQYFYIRQSTMNIIAFKAKVNYQLDHL